MPLTGNIRLSLLATVGAEPRERNSLLPNVVPRRPDHWTPANPRGHANLDDTGQAGCYKPVSNHQERISLLCGSYELP